MQPDMLMEEIQLYAVPLGTAGLFWGGEQCDESWVSGTVCLAMQRVSLVGRVQYCYVLVQVRAGHGV
jgi:hypothetical protein